MSENNGNKERTPEISENIDKVEIIASEIGDVAWMNRNGTMDTGNFLVYSLINDKEKIGETDEYVVFEAKQGGNPPVKEEGIR